MANNKRINIGVGLTIDKSGLNDLSQALDKVIDKARLMRESGGDYAIPYEEAARAAQDLKNALDKSYNNKLGKIDMSKATMQIKNLYGNTKDFKNILTQIGPEGERAFFQFAKSISSAQAPLKKTNSELDKMAISMANTVRFGIASSAWNNFTGSISKAYSFVKNLDKSLNNIRIVSGQSAAQMEKFAIAANKAAASLGATTLDYTDAALIYYQQGLSEQEIIERTNVTVKMSNVLGTSAEQVSDYMTAIWNNFDNGSKSLEYYADVITALGAATASSAEEISTGLEKFAAVADTVGLSYEYATSALATVTSETRQSAEVVGTAFKTIFARIQGLSLGETLEDGTTLNKYSAALESVGINIKDSNGELKSMDVILDEMGDKWKKIGKDQQVALAQTVAGVRQYNQLVALLENWDEVEQNINFTMTTEGSLDEQNKIFKEGLEGSLNKLTTNLESIWQKILPEELLATLVDAFAKMAKLVDTFLAGLGDGLNRLVFLGGLLMNIFQGPLAEAVGDVKQNLEVSKSDVQQAEALAEIIKGITTDLQTDSTDGIRSKMEIQKELYEDLLLYAKNLNEEEQEFIQNQILKIAKLEEEKKIRELAIKEIQAEYESIQNPSSDFNKANEFYSKDAIDDEKMQYAAYESAANTQIGNVVKAAEKDELVSQLFDQITLQGGFQTEEDLSYFANFIRSNKNIPNTQETQAGAFGFESILGKIPDINDETFKKATQYATRTNVDKAESIFLDFEDVKNIFDALLKYMSDFEDQLKYRIEENKKVGDIDQFEAYNAKLREVHSQKENVTSASNKIFNAVVNEENVALTEEESLDLAKAMSEYQVKINAELKEEQNIYEDILVLRNKYTKKASEQQHITKLNTQEIEEQSQKEKEALETVKKRNSYYDEIQDKIAATSTLVTSISSIWGTFQNVKLDLTDEDGKLQMDTLVQAYSVLSVQTMLIATNWKKIRDAVADYQAKLAVQIIYTGALSKIEGELTAKKVEQLFTSGQLNSAQISYLAGKAQELLIEKGIIKEGEKKTNQQLINLAAEQGLILLKGKENGEAIRAFMYENKRGFALGASVVKQTAINIAKGVELGLQKLIAFFTSMTVGSIATIVVLVGGLLVGLALWLDHQKEINSETYKAEQALKATQEIVTSLKEEYQELKDTISNYQDAKKGIEGLTQGTLEFNEALLAANESALQLIETHGLVAGKDYTLNGTTGLIEINEDSLNSLLEGKQSQQYASMGSYYQQQAELLKISDKEGLQKIYNDLSDSINKKFEEINIEQTMTPEFAKLILEGDLNGKDGLQHSVEDVSNKLNNLKNIDVNTGQITNLVDITDEINKQIPQYTYLLDEITRYERLAADSFIRAFGDTVNLAEYQQASRAQQQIIQDYYSKDKGTENLENDHTQTDMQKWAENSAYNSMSYQWGTVGSSIWNLGDEGSWGYDEETQKRLEKVENAEKLIEAYYKDTARGGKAEYSRDEDGNWTNKNGESVYIWDEVSEDEFNTIKSTYKTAGTETTNAILDDIIGTITKTQGEAASQGFDSESQSYIGEAAAALKTYGTKETGLYIDEEAKQKAYDEKYEDVMYLTDDEDTAKELAESTVKSKEESGEFTRYNAEKSNYDFSALTDEELDELARQYPEYESIVESIKISLDSTARQAARAQQDLINFNHQIKNEADALGVSEKALKLYAKATMNAEESLSKQNRTTAKAIGAEYKFNKIYNEGVSTFEDNKDAYKEYIKALKNGEKVSHDVAEATAELQESLEGVLGLEVDADFMEKESENIIKLFTGTEKEAEEAFKALQSSALKTAFQELATEIGLSNDEFTTFWSTFQEIQNSDTGLTFNANTSDFVNDVRKMMGTSLSSVEEAQQWLDDHNLIIEQGVSSTAAIEEFKLPESKETKRHTITGQNPMTGAPLDAPIEYEETITMGGGSYFALTDDDTDIQVKSGGSNFTNFKKTQANKQKQNSGSGKSSKKQDPQKDELDRYQKVNSQLDKIGNTLDKLEDKKDKLTGKKLFDNLYAQFDTLNDKIDVTKDKLAIAIDEMNEYKQELAKDYGIKFGADGIIQNYKEQYYKELNALNAVINKYGDSDKDSDQEKVEKAQERYDKYTELIEKYDELLGSTIPGLEKDVRDAIDTQIELKVETFKYELDLKLDIKDAKLEWNEFKKTVLDGIEETDILGNTQAKLKDVEVYFEGVERNILETNTNKINDLLTDLKKMDEDLDGKIYKDERQQAMDDLKEYYEAAVSNLTEIHELSEEIHDSYMEMMDEAQEKFDEQIEAYSTISDLIEHDKNVITMIYGEESYSALSKFYDKQESNNNKQLDFQKKQVEFWANQMTLVEEGSEEWDKAKENWLSAVSEWNSAVEAAIQNLQDKYLNAINEIFQKLNNEVTGGLGLGYVEEEWSLINRNAEEYLDSVNAIYGVQQLQSKYLDAIEQNDSTIQQKKLNDLMEQEMGYLREQDKLSQYDLDRANLKYEIALKQIALEEAQQNKTQLRLRRDSQGNYTYQYTQDDDQVSSIQQEISDLYNQLYNLDAEEYRGNLESLYDVWVEFQEKMAEAAQINDPEQRAERELLIKEQYGELINTLAEKNELVQVNLNQSTMSHLFDLYDQNIENYDMMTSEQQAILDQFMTTETDFTNAAFDNLFNLYNLTVENFKGMSSEQQDILMGEIVPQWETAVQAMADKIIGEGGFFPVCAEAFSQLAEATESYETSLKTLQETAGTSFEEVKEGIDPVIESTELLLKDNNDLITSYENELQAVQDVIDKLDALKDKYSEVIEKTKEATEAAAKYWMDASNTDAEADPSKVLDEEFGTETDVTTDLNQPSTDNNSPQESVKPALEKGSYVEVKAGTKWYANSYGGGASGRAKSGTIKYINTKGSHAYNINGAGWIKKTDIVGYATGGYTGDWAGGDGRLAMLHQKELVLNANDTKNMLSAIEIVREITSNLGTMLMSRMANIGAITTQGANSGELEQNVHITAEFPNVTSSREIEEALNNLTNKASQYIQKN